MKTKIKEFIGGFIEGQKLFGEDIGTLVNSVLLSFVYFVGVGLTSIFMKLFGKKFLDLKTDKNSKTYWVDLNLGKKPTEEYFRQF